jgi:hypothetical protein
VGPEKEADMKYVVLIFNNPGAFESMTDQERDFLMSEADAFLKEFSNTGELLGGSALADVATAKTVRVSDAGVPAVTDGPFAEAKEYLAGFYTLDCESIERACEIASKDPAAKLWGVEVRPVMDESGPDV